MAAFTMFGETVRSLLKKPVTIDYPFAPRSYPPAYRGRIAIQALECTLCVLCDKRCPTAALKVDRVAKTWTIDRLRCIACNYCVEVCPKKCLLMENVYSAPMTARSTDVVAIPYTMPPPKPTVAALPKEGS